LNGFTGIKSIPWSRWTSNLQTETAVERLHHQRPLFRGGMALRLDPPVVLIPQNIHFPLTCCVALTTVYALPCDTDNIQRDEKGSEALPCSGVLVVREKMRSSESTTRSSADADKPARRVWRSVKVTKHSTIPYIRYSFLLCNSNFVFKMCNAYRVHMTGTKIVLRLESAVYHHYIRLQKCCDLEMGSKVTQGHSQWYHSIDGVWFPISIL